MQRTHAFDGAFRKIERAAHHIQMLESEIEAFLTGDAYETVTTFDPQLDAYRVYVRVHRELPDHWPLLVGDAVHNLRSALDHAVFALASNHGPPAQPNDLQFVIVDDPAKFPGQACRWLAQLQPDERAHIEHLQPYHEFRSATTFPLSLLRDLSNTDKHRELPLVFYRVGGGTWPKAAGEFLGFSD